MLYDRLQPSHLPVSLLLSTLLVSLPTPPSTGTIPEEVYSLVALTTLNLAYTKTEGLLPDMIPKLQKLPLLQGLWLGRGTSGKQSARVIIMGPHFQLWFFQENDSVIHSFTNDVHYPPTPTSSPGVTPAGIGNLVQLNTLDLRYTKVSGTCGVPLQCAF
jgi:hypothetical protein